MRRVLTVVLMVLLALGVLAPPASAERTGDPYVVSPASDSGFWAPWDGPITVDFSQAPPGEYFVSVVNSYDSWNRSDWADQLGGPVQVQDDTGIVELRLSEPLVKPGDYMVTVKDSFGSGHLVPFGVRDYVSDGNPVITPIGDIESGSPYSAQVDMSKAQMGRYNAELCLHDQQGGIQCEFLQSIHNTQSMTTVDVPLPAISESTQASLRVWYEDAKRNTFSDDEPFQVTGPLHLRDLRATPSVIYPLRDGYKDKTRITFDSNDRLAEVRMQIFDGNSRVHVAHGENTHAFTWDGRDSKGRPLAPKDYRIVIDGTSVFGGQDTATGKVTTARKTVISSDSADRRGTDTSLRSRKGCATRAYGGELTLDCWGGHHAEVKYAFRIPKSARNLDWSIRGTVNCCDVGVLSRTGKRVSDRRYEVTVRVTNWRSFTINRVSLDWKYKLQR